MKAGYHAKNVTIMINGQPIQQFTGTVDWSFDGVEDVVSPGWDGDWDDGEAVFEEVLRELGRGGAS